MSESFIQRSAFESWPIAKPLHRTSAFFVDAVLTALLVCSFLYYFKLPIAPQNTFFFWLIAMWFWEAFFTIFWGTSPGKKLLGLELFAPKHDGIPSPVQISLRIIVFWISFFLLCVGLLPILNRRDHRGWHDQVSETLIVGKSRSYPNPFFVKTIPIFTLVLSLILFAGIGAKIFSLGSEKSYGESINESCDKIDNFILDADSSLTALLISPAWRSCWISIQNIYSNFNNSSFYQLMELTKEYHDAFYLPSSERQNYYQKYLQKKEEQICSKGSSKECNSSKFLSATLLDNDITISDHWFYKNQKALEFLRKNTDTYIESISSKNHLLTPHLKEEILASLDTSYSFSQSLKSSNPEWKKGIICLKQIYSGFNPTQCELWLKAESAIREALKGNLDNLDQFLANHPKDFLYFELVEIRNYLINNAKEDLSEALKTYPKSRLFYPLLKSFS